MQHASTSDIQYIDEEQKPTSAEHEPRRKIKSLVPATAAETPLQTPCSFTFSNSSFCCHISFCCQLFILRWTLRGKWRRAKNTPKSTRIWIFLDLENISIRVYRWLQTPNIHSRSLGTGTSMLAFCISNCLWYKFTMWIEIYIAAGLRQSCFFDRQSWHSSPLHGWFSWLPSIRTWKTALPVLVVHSHAINRLLSPLLYGILSSAPQAARRGFIYPTPCHFLLCKEHVL